MNHSHDSQLAEQIRNGQTILGIEMGSTRIKAVLTGVDSRPIATGNFGWENSQENGVWTYSLDEMWQGIQSCFAELQNQVEALTGLRIQKLKSLGVSGMMHGYLVFDAEDHLLTPFRTWRNTFTAEASKELTDCFQYPIPQRWSIAHLYQAMLKQEPHVPYIAHITTLAGYVHWKLTGQQVLGIGEASGMFPIDLQTQQYNREHMNLFDRKVLDAGLSWTLNEILPQVRQAGDLAGELTEQGAALLDPTGTLAAGNPLCPPEGDAGTGMVATNSVDLCMGNVSAGTSVFAMLVLEKELSRAHPEIDLVTTPDGKLVGMAHSNNCSSDIDAWIKLFAEATQALGMDLSPTDLYNKLLPTALQGDADCGGLLSYGYLSGEHITGFEEGRPLMTRSPDSTFSLANFMRMHLFTALCAMRTGLDVLLKEEGAKIKAIRGHGGFFKTPEVGQRIMAAATGAPVSLLESSGEGGAWGMALLAGFAVRENRTETLPDFLHKVFEGRMSEPLAPNPEDVAGFESYFKRYHQGLDIEQAAIDALR
ncbi:FGGY-family carbohydrate kinase [Kiritimatiellota bacterium B12222]|nr:FGGY-family carbohydrate kinase [Kiritimatiellota bacterium B12222]